MNFISPEILLTHLDWTIRRLDEILQRDNTPYFRSAAIQRFGLTYEMAIRCIQAFKYKRISSLDAWEADSCADWRELANSYNKLRQSLIKKDALEGSENSQQYGNDEIFPKLGQYQATFQKLYNHLNTLTNS